MSKDYDYSFKIVIAGDSGVGKSSLLARYADDSFTENYLATIGVDFKFKTIGLDEKKWDTAGQERFRTITSAYYKGADSIVLVYDTCNKSSFQNIEGYWVNEVESYGEKDVDILLLGNKSDLDSAREVGKSDAEEYAQRRKMEFFEVSAKTADKVDLAFTTLARKLVLKKDEKQMKKSGRMSKEMKPSVTASTGKIQLGESNNAQQDDGLLQRFSQGCC